MARTMELVVEFVMKNHIYSFDGKVYRQSAGGPIGLELTGVLAKIVMLWWDRKYLQKLTQLNIRLKLYKRYVDDQNSALGEVKPGIEFIEGNLELNEDKVETDKLIEGGIRTGRILTKIANSISPMIQVEEDVPSYNEDKKLSILDLEVWPEDGKIRNVFYKIRNVFY